MVASAVTKGNGFCKCVCIYVKLGVSAVRVSAAYGVKLFAVCIECEACISCIESNAGSCIEIKSYSCNNAAVVICISSALGRSTYVIADY